MALLQDIRYLGDNKTFVWRSDIEDFSLGSSLTVDPSQEALFISNGEALDLFPSGRYVLKTHNIPLLRKVHEKLYGGDTPFHCSIYFINLVDQMAVPWGTFPQIEYLDPVLDIPFKIGMSGDMILRVTDSRKVVLRLVGNEKVLLQEQVRENFQEILMSKLKPYFARFVKEKQISIFDIDAYLDVFSDEIKPIVAPEFENYGFELIRFAVGGVKKPEDDRDYARFKALRYRRHTEIGEAQLEAQKQAIRMDIESEAIARKRIREGYTYQQERGYDVAQDVARNEASGQFANLGIGLGTMAGVGGVMGGLMGNTLSNAFDAQGQPVQPQQSVPQQPVQQPNAPSAEDPVAVLEKLKLMLDKGLISQEQYDGKAAEILSRM